MRTIHRLTRPEALVLALIARNGPINAYELRVLIGSSPTRSFSSSEGTIYPIVRRLKAYGLITGERLKDDGRRAELLSCTEEGRRQTREWLRHLDEESLLIEDPLRTRMFYLDMLGRDDQLRWLRQTRAALAAAEAEIETFATKNPGYFEAFAHENARLSLRTRREWIDRVLEKLEADTIRTRRSVKTRHASRPPEQPVSSRRSRAVGRSKS